MINEYETLFNISLSNQNIYTKTVKIRKEIVEYIFLSDEYSTKAKLCFIRSELNFL